jgi:hypothetical protein
MTRNHGGVVPYKIKIREEIHKMPTTNKDLSIYFQRADGKEFKITIPDYKEGITDAEIKAGAQAILDQGAFLPDGFGLVKVTGAVRVDTTKTEVVIEEAV